MRKKNAKHMRRKLLQFTMTDGNVVRMFHYEKLRERWKRVFLARTRKIKNFAGVKFIYYVKINFEIVLVAFEIEKRFVKFSGKN